MFWKLIGQNLVKVCRRIGQNIQSTGTWLVRTRRIVLEWRHTASNHSGRAAGENHARFMWVPEQNIPCHWSSLYKLSHVGWVLAQFGPIGLSSNLHWSLQHCAPQIQTPIILKLKKLQRMYHYCNGRCGGSVCRPWGNGGHLGSRGRQGTRPARRGKGRTVGTRQWRRIDSTKCLRT